MVRVKEGQEEYTDGHEDTLQGHGCPVEGVSDRVLRRERQDGCPTPLYRRPAWQTIGCRALVQQALVSVISKAGDRPWEKAWKRFCLVARTCVASGSACQVEAVVVT